MISVIVERPPADKQGPNIVDKLITTNAAAIERGRNEIDANCSSRELIKTSSPLDGFIYTGRLIEVSDSELQAWRGMIRSSVINISADNNSFETQTNLTIERIV